jgi:alpha-L-fucosidase
VDIVGKGGNFLLNVGPQPDGELPAATAQRLKEIGAWMKVNGEAIYGTRPIAPYKDGPVVFTRKNQFVYAIYLAELDGDDLPAAVSFLGPKPAPGSTIRLLGAQKTWPWQADAAGRVVVTVPETLRKSPPCRHAFVFRFEPVLMP